VLRSRFQMTRLLVSGRPLARAGRSIDGIARELGIGYGTAWNYVKALER
jgi:molybdenum-dependent DNA-binding transcriptional regulator ModE